MTLEKYDALVEKLIAEGYPPGTAEEMACDQLTAEGEEQATKLWSNAEVMGYFNLSDEEWDAIPPGVQAKLIIKLSVD